MSPYCSSAESLMSFAIDLPPYNSIKALYAQGGSTCLLASVAITLSQWPEAQQSILIRRHASFAQLPGRYLTIQASLDVSLIFSVPLRTLLVASAVTVLCKRYHRVQKRSTRSHRERQASVSWLSLDILNLIRPPYQTSRIGTNFQYSVHLSPRECN